MKHVEQKFNWNIGIELYLFKKLLKNICKNCIFGNS